MLVTFNAGILDDPTNLDKGRTRTYCACRGAIRSIVFFTYRIFSFSLSLGDGSVKAEILFH